MTYAGSLLGGVEEVVEDCINMGRNLSRSAASKQQRSSVSCRKVIGMLADHIDGTLPIAELRAFRHHIDVCPRCRAFFASYGTVVRIAPIACQAEADIPPDVSVRLRQVLGIERPH